MRAVTKSPPNSTRANIIMWNEYSGIISFEKIKWNWVFVSCKFEKIDFFVAYWI